MKENSTFCPNICFLFAQEEEDLQYEEEILRNPFSVKCWIRYIDFKQNAPKHILNLIYERALKELPGRYSYLLLIMSVLKITFLQILTLFF